MAEPILYVDRSRVHEGRLAELKAAMTDLVAFIVEHEPDIGSYRVYFDEQQERMTVVHTHRNAETLAYHMDVAGHKFAPIGEYLELEAIDVYGELGDDLAERLQEKAAPLGRGEVRIHAPHGSIRD